ncbi:MAG: hypothetical protein V9E86_03230 [Nitrosomonas sp.]
MLRNSSTIHQPNLFGTDLLMQLDPGDPLLNRCINDTVARV